MALVIRQGEQAPIEIDLRQANGRPYDLTGKQVVAQVKLNNVATNLNCSVSGNPILGIIILTLSDVQTAQLKKGDCPIYVYVGTYASAPTIAPLTDVTDDIFYISSQVTVEAGAL